MWPIANLEYTHYETDKWYSQGTLFAAQHIKCWYIKEILSYLGEIHRPTKETGQQVKQPSVRK
jgi:hypothetical protein